MNLESIRQNKAGMILQFSIPAIIAMVLTSLITVTDGFFTGNYIGKEAIAAINLGLPIVYLYLGVGLMISVGGSVIAGMQLGAREIEKAKNTFNQTMFMAMIAAVLLSIIIALFFDPIASLLHVDSTTNIYFKNYYWILLLELPLLIINNSFGMFIRGEGNPQFFMKVSIINVLGNVVLDYVFVGPLQMGIRGIAAASLLTAVIALFMILYYFLRKAKVYGFARFTFDGQIAREMLLNGSSEFIGEMSMCITMYAYNLVILRKFGVDGITAFTVVGYVSYVFSMILTGFGQGCSPLISFTHGAKDYQTEKGLRRLTNLYVLGTGIVVILIMMFAAGGYSSLFVSGDGVRVMITSGVRLFVLSFLFSGINTITSFYFTSIGKAKESAVISSMRGLVILLICIILLPQFLGLTGVWLVAPMTEFLTFLISIFYLFQKEKM